MKKQLTSAFTLIELLVVITIIAILAGIALPVYGTIQERGQQTKALAQAKQIGLALRLYASDNDGSYPGQGTVDPNSTTNAVLPAPGAAALPFLAAIVPTYVPDESIFFVAGSKWSTTKPDLDEILETGENHWAYTAGLRDVSSPRMPLLADGFSGTIGTYTDKEGLKGGLWKGKKAVVLRVDQSGTVETLKKDFQVKENIKTEVGANIFTSTALKDAGGKTTNPE